MGVARALLILLWFSTGCGQGCETRALRVGGPHPYVRCLAREVADRAKRRVGSVSARLEDGTLTLEAPGPVRVAFFSGPEDSSQPLGAGLAEAVGAGAHVLVVLGGLGRDPARLAPRLDELAATQRPVLLLSGGGDGAAVVPDAYQRMAAAGRDFVFPLDGVRSVIVAGAELIPVPGAPAGRYAVGEDACGHGRADLEDLAASLSQPRASTVRYLLSWAAPAGSPAAEGLLGVDVGDPDLRWLAREIGSKGGIFAFPSEQAGRVWGTEAGVAVVAPPLQNPSVLDAQGGVVAPRAVLLEATSQGLRPLPRSAAPP